MCLVLLPRNHLQWRVTTTRRLHYVSSITLVHPPHRNLDSSYHTPARTSSSIVPSSPHPYPWDKEGFSFSSPHPSSSSSSSANRKPCLKKWKTILSKNFKYETLQMPSGPLPQLKHGLDRVLFNPGAHFLQDPRTFLYNFDPYLQKIIQPNEINYDTFSPYVISSKDQKLHELSERHGCQFFSSTSSITSVLSQLYFALTGPKKLNLRRLTAPFADSPDTFTKLMRIPCSIFLRKVGNNYSIDADKSFDSGDHVLSLLGRSMESMLTKSRQEFTMHLKKTETSVLKKPMESYFFGKAGRLLLRAQLDCYDPRLPRRIFDLKTRAAFPIRMDAQHYDDYLLYHITKTYGFLGSFEREYFDMMRSAFLKYCFQVRIGHMDGIFVTYHNTARIFGFQYIPLEELDECLFGSTSMGHQVFALTLQLLETLLKDVVQRYPHAHLLRLTFDFETASTHSLTQGSGGGVVVYIEEAVDETQPLLPRHFLSQENATVACLRMELKNIINRKLITSDHEIELKHHKDAWNLNYCLDYESPNEAIALEYFRTRRLQSAVLGKSSSSRASTKSLRILKESKLGSITPEALERLQNRMKKVYLSPQLGFPVGKHGWVVDDGWDL